MVSANNYCPIALTSCICKTMERMVNDRLVWFLEKEQILSQSQSGFRKRRSTVDQLIKLETLVRESFIQGHHGVAVFFDLEKAYDTTWKYGIKKDLHSAGLRGRLPEFISGFLNDRNFRVRIGAILSDEYEQEMGVPQGCILSVTLFCLKINSIVKTLLPDTECSLYVDDFLIFFHSRHMPTIERHLQRVLNKLQVWADENGFKFSTSKTVVMHYCRMKKEHSHPELFLNNTALPVVEETKFLGLIFDSKLTFIPHLKYLRKKRLQAINLLRVVGHYDWGADSTTLLKLYDSTIRSKLDYGCMVYGSACDSYLKMLDPIQNKALRICLGAFRTSPIPSLQVYSKRPPLDLRRTKLGLQYALQLKSNPFNPTHKIVFQPRFAELFANKPKSTPTFGIRTLNHFKTANISLDNIGTIELPKTPPWTICSPSILLNLAEDKKSDTSSTFYMIKFKEIVENFSEYEQIYTDGSKQGDRVGAAALVPNGAQKSIRLPNKSSIYSAELRALLLALELIEGSTKKLFIIFSDSLSVMQALKNPHPDHPLVGEILSWHTNITVHLELSIFFCWVPGHIGIPGNEQVDDLAKLAVNLDSSEEPMFFMDLKPSINEHLTNIWQNRWSQSSPNKFLEIVPDLKGWKVPLLQQTRKVLFKNKCAFCYSEPLSPILFAILS